MVILFNYSIGPECHTPTTQQRSRMRAEALQKGLNVLAKSHLHSTLGMVKLRQARVETHDPEFVDEVPIRMV